MRKEQIEQIRTLCENLEDEGVLLLIATSRVDEDHSEMSVTIRANSQMLEVALIEAFKGSEPLKRAAMSALQRVMIEEMFGSKESD